MSRRREEGTGGASPLRVPIARTPGNEDLPLPAPATRGAVGLDLRAALAGERVIEPGARAAIPTGFCIALPEGYEAQIRPRSGLALDSGIVLPNAPGTIDPDYRGELLVILWNAGSEPFTVRRGDRIAQLVVAPVVRADWLEVEALEPSARGAGGLGHTGFRDAPRGKTGPEGKAS
jgi:dUTP pyrophosphatase